MLLVKAKELEAVKTDLEGQIETLSTRLKTAKARILQLEADNQSLDEKIRAAMTEFIEKKLKRTALKALDAMMQQVHDDIMNKATNQLFSMIESIAHSVVKSHIDKKVRWKVKKFVGSEIEVSKILVLYDSGWRVSFYGKLKGDEEILLMEKPVTQENENGKPKREPRS
jgi:L-lactate utilization protein LutB